MKKEKKSSEETIKQEILPESEAAIKAETATEEAPVASNETAADDKSPPADAEIGIAEDASEIIEKVEPDETEALKIKCAEYLDKLQRTMADFDNFRKRTVKEKTSMYDDGVRDTIEKLLPIIDNFERAAASASPENKKDAFFKGVSLIQRQLAGYLDDIGVEPAEEPGDKFDPNRHFAVAHIEDENLTAGEIVEVMQKGYIYKNKVIRCSMVKVAN